MEVRRIVGLGFSKNFYKNAMLLILLFFDKIIVGAKAVDTNINNDHIAQGLNYLKASG